MGMIINRTDSAYTSQIIILDKKYFDFVCWYFFLYYLCAVFEAQIIVLLFNLQENEKVSFISRCNRQHVSLRLRFI